MIRNSNSKIEKLKNKIKKEKEKLKLYKNKNKKSKKGIKSKIFLKKIFFINNKDKKIFSNFFDSLFYGFICMLFGIFICLIVFLILTGGKNYFKLYYELRDFIDVYDTISNEYYNNINKEEFIDSAIDSMVNSVGDGYTIYSNKENSEDFFENVEGTYNGIGCLVSMNENSDIYVVEVFEGGPAEVAGIKPNDVIVKVDGVDYSEKTSEDMASYVKGSTEDFVVFGVKRGDDEKNIKVDLKKVEIPSVNARIIDNDNKKIGYIGVDLFSSVASNQFKNKLIELEKEKISGLIVDLRGNSGGYLSVVTDITSMFLKKGDVIYQLDNKKNKVKKIKDETKEKRNYQVVVLVNEGSASASEIFAAAIKDSYGGHVVGVNTFGKGSVQKVKKFSNGSMIKYTTEKWLTPSGKSIDGDGIKPTDEIEFSLDGFENDSQLDYAIKLIK